MTVSTYTVELEDKISPNAKNAAEQVKSLSAAMAGLERAAVKAAALGDVAGIQKAADKYRMLSTEVNRLGSEFPKASESSGMLADGLGSLGSGAMALVEAGAVAAAAAVVAFGAALYEGGKFALEASERVNVLRAAFEGLAGGAPGSGQKTLDAVRAVAKEVPESEAVVQSWARTLMAAGVTDMTNLRNSLKAVAGAEALVEGGGERARGILAKVAEQALAGGGKVKFSLASLSGSGLSEKEFLGALGMTPQNFAAAKKAGTLTGQQIGDAITKGLTEKSQGALNASMSTWDAAVAKGKDLISHLFEGVDVEPLMAAVRSFFEVFDLAEPSGQALKSGIGGTFKWLFGMMANGIMDAKHLFLQLELSLLETANANKPLIKSFMQWSSVSGVRTVVTDLKDLATAAEIALAPIVKLYQAGKWLFDHGVSLVGKIAFAAEDDQLNTEARARAGQDVPAWKAKAAGLAPHAEGGVVTDISGGIARVRAAPGEGLASIGRGEQIVPADRGGSTSNSQRNEINVAIHAKDNATATELAHLFEEQMASIFERLALSQGVAP